MSDGAWFVGGCIAAIFRNGTGVAIFVDRFLDRCPIWLCIYCKKVSPDHLPCFIIVVSDSPCSFNDIAPPARSEWTPTMSGSIPLSSRCKSLTLLRMQVIMSVGVTEQSSWSCLYTQIKDESAPWFRSMWFTLRANALIGHYLSSMASWWMVCPIFPFFWLEIFRVAEWAVNSSSKLVFWSSCFWFFQKPTSCTLNWMVRVARTSRPFLFTCLGAVYSPTRSK